MAQVEETVDFTVLMGRPRKWTDIPTIERLLEIFDRVLNEQNLQTHDEMIAAFRRLVKARAAGRCAAIQAAAVSLAGGRARAAAADAGRSSRLREAGLVRPPSAASAGVTPFQEAAGRVLAAGHAGR
jgi:hypothetical protein